MLAGGSSGTGGVRNLCAIFENKSNDRSISPPSRGRSPNGSISSSHSRPVSKVRATFVAVERPVDSGQEVQVGVKKLADNTIMDSSSEIARVVNGQKESSGGPDLGAILKGSAFESSGPMKQEATTQGTDSAQHIGVLESQPQASGNKKTSPVKPPQISTAKNAPPAENSTAQPKTQTTSPTLTKQSPTLSKNSPLPLKPSIKPESLSAASPPFKLKGGVNKIEGVMRSADAAKQERESVAGGTNPAVASGPDAKPRGGVSKIKGVMESAEKAREERELAAKVTKSPSTTTGPVARPRGGVSKIQGVMESAQDAREARQAAAEDTKSPIIPVSPSAAGRPFKLRGGVNKIQGVMESAERAREQRQTVAKDLKAAPAVAHKNTAPARDRATTNGVAKKEFHKKEVSTASQSGQIPTSPAKPTKLPSAATATTAASAARMDSKHLVDTQKPKTAERHSIAKPPYKAAATATKSSLAKKTSRASLTNGNDGPKSRVGVASRPADENFLARLTKPTASSAQKAHDKVQINSPPRSRHDSFSQKDLRKKSSRRSLTSAEKPTEESIEVDANHEMSTSGHVEPPLDTVDERTEVATTAASAIDDQ